MFYFLDLFKFESLCAMNSSNLDSRSIKQALEPYFFSTNSPSSLKGVETNAYSHGLMLFSELKFLLVGREHT